MHHEASSLPRPDDRPDEKSVAADLIICWRGEWEARPEHNDPGWIIVRDHAKLFCLKIAGLDRARAL